MKHIYFFSIFIILFKFSSSLPSCFYIIKNLAEQDQCLSSRSDLKVTAAKDAETVDQFVSLLQDKIICNGTYYNCGGTTCWVSEIFIGLANHFYDHKYTKYDKSDEFIKGGYIHLVGNEVKEYFKKATLRDESYLYTLKQKGTRDHALNVEQLAYQKGFRIYQSFIDAYSLKAWLSQDISGLFGNNSEIMFPIKRINNINRFLKNHTDGKVDLNNLDELPKKFNHMLPYLEYYRDLTKEEIIESFKLAWKKYGKGRVLTREEFLEYISTTGEVTEYFSKYDNTTELYSEEINDKFIELYGTPDPNYFINLPCNFLREIGYNSTDKEYRFMIKEYMLEDTERGRRKICHENKRFMLGKLKRKKKKLRKSNRKRLIENILEKIKI